MLVVGSHVRAEDECSGNQYPHGSYCEGESRGGYGEKNAVRSSAEARKVIANYFSSVRGVKITIIEEKEWFFKAEVRDRQNKLIDIVIIDKRSGRIRSIY